METKIPFNQLSSHEPLPTGHRVDTAHRLRKTSLDVSSVSGHAEASVLPDHAIAADKVGPVGLSALTGRCVSDGQHQNPSQSSSRQFFHIK